MLVAHVILSFPGRPSHIVSSVVQSVIRCPSGSFCDRFAATASPAQQGHHSVGGLVQARHPGEGRAIQATCYTCKPRHERERESERGYV